MIVNKYTDRRNMPFYNPISIMNIPNHAKSVFSGVDFTIFQWEQELFDGSMTTFEMASGIDAAKAIVVTDRGTILVNREEQPHRGSYTVLPGGLIEKNEAPEKAILREVLEETGYRPETVELFVVEHPWFRLACRGYCYIARNCRFVQAPILDAGERIETIEMDIGDFIEEVLDGKIQARALRTEFLLEYRKDPQLVELKKRILWI